MFPTLGFFSNQNGTWGKPMFNLFDTDRFREYVPVNTFDRGKQILCTLYSFSPPLNIKCTMTDL